MIEGYSKPLALGSFGLSHCVGVWDFTNDSDLSDFLMHETNAGTVPTAVLDAAFGTCLFTTDTADNDRYSCQVEGEFILPTANKEFWVVARFKVSEATEIDVLFGVVPGGATPDYITTASTNGIWFLKDDGAALWEANHYSTEVVVDDANVGTLVADTFVTMAIRVQCKSVATKADIDYFIDGVNVCTVKDATLAAATELTPLIMFQNGSAAARTMTLDYIGFSVER